jgi:hypothetical protein
MRAMQLAASESVHTNLAGLLVLICASVIVVVWVILRLGAAWRRADMGVRGAVVAGTITSLAVTAVWSWTAMLTIGTAPPLHLGSALPVDYARLADAATGDGRALFAVVAAVYFMCFLVSGLRRRKRQHLAAGNGWEPSPRQNFPSRRSVSQ